MKYRVASVFGITDPPDGYESQEEELARLISSLTYSEIYKKLPTSRMKAIVAMHFELGMPQEVVADIFDIKQPTLNEEIDNIKKVLSGKKYKPQRQENLISTKDLLSLCLQLQRV